MAIDLNNLGRMSRGKKIDPREIFMALPSKNEKYDYPRDVQSEVWKKWFEKRKLPVLFPHSSNFLISLMPLLFSHYRYSF